MKLRDKLGVLTFGSDGAKLFAKHQLED